MSAQFEQESTTTTTLAVDIVPADGQMRVQLSQFLEADQPNGIRAIVARAGLSGLPGGRLERMVARIPPHPAANAHEKAWLRDFAEEIVEAVQEADGTNIESPVRLHVEILCLPVHPYTRARAQAAAAYAKGRWAWGPW